MKSARLRVLAVILSLVVIAPASADIWSECDTGPNILMTKCIWDRYETYSTPKHSLTAHHRPNSECRQVSRSVLGRCGNWYDAIRTTAASLGRQTGVHLLAAVVGCELSLAITH